MRVDVLAIGTELLLGQIVDTNSSWIGEHLAEAGLDTCEHRKVGDNLGRMVTCLRELLDRSRCRHRLRRYRTHARRRHSRGHRGGDGRRAGTTRGAHRADPAHLRRAWPPDAREQPAASRRPRRWRRDPQPDRHRARAALRSGRQDRVRSARGAVRDDRDDHEVRAARPTRTFRGALGHRVAFAEDMGRVGIGSGGDDRRSGRPADEPHRSRSWRVVSRASTCA